MPKNLKKIAKDFTPHGLLKIKKNIKERLHQMTGTLFNGDDACFKQILTNAKVYGEYGVGESTKWVLNNTSAHITAVDTSEKWIKQVMDSTKLGNRLDCTYVELGDLGEWGRPTSYKYRENIKHYCMTIWNKDLKPDVVLIDGRFRVYCFLYSLRCAAPGTTIIFDDFSIRPNYHIVLEVIKPTETCGRQYIFTVPDKSELEIEKIDKLINKFEYVMD